MCLRFDSRDFIPDNVLRVSLLLRKFQGERSRTAPRNLDTPHWTAPRSEVHNQIVRTPRGLSGPDSSHTSPPSRCQNHERCLLVSSGFMISKQLWSRTSPCKHLHPHVSQRAPLNIAEWETGEESRACAFAGSATHPNSAGRSTRDAETFEKCSFIRSWVSCIF